jgi:hypothetical protein
VSFKDSYDPQSLKTLLRIKNLYHNHQHVLITKVNDTDFEITVPRDSRFPNGAIPIIAYTHNGAYESLPVFINFFFQPIEFLDLGYSYAELSSDPSMLTSKPKSEVFNNFIPIIKYVGPEKIKAQMTNQLKFNCTDPEGFSTRMYQWKTDNHLISALGEMVLMPEAKDVGKRITFHVICSDGTGGFSGRHFNFDVIAN